MSVVLTRHGAAMAASLLLASVLPARAAAGAAASKGFLEDQSEIGSKAFQDDIRDATGAMMGCGGQIAAGKLSSIEGVLLPMWRTMPKNTHGYIERRSLRHLVHRYFTQRSSMMIRGFEPSRPVNQSHWGVADILSEQVPGYVEAVLESKRAERHGFSLEDAANMVVMLDQLIFDSESKILEKAFASQGKSRQDTLSHQALTQVLEAYLVHWMLGGDDEAISMVLANRSLLLDSVPHWEAIVAFAEGQIKALEFHRQRAPRPPFGKNLWAKFYSLEDAHEVVGSITSSFQSFWESECVSMKKALVSMDKHRTGRVALSKFYASAINSDWRFGESEAYLRELGALDETSHWNSKQVIIPNYLQATSNCIVSTPHYRVCCVSECETHLAELEAEVGAPVAEPSAILAIVGNITSLLALDSDLSPELDDSLVVQLQQVAEMHGGKVPLHGRLFAQWLHYVFPHECPFPHKTGSIATLAPTEFGDDYMAQDEDMKKLARNASASDARLAASREDLHWMSQWSEEEEFIVDYSHELRNKWGVVHGLVVVAGLAVLIMGGAVGFGRTGDSPKATGGSTKGQWV